MLLCDRDWLALAVGVVNAVADNAVRVSVRDPDPDTTAVVRLRWHRGVVPLVLLVSRRVRHRRGLHLQRGLGGRRRLGPSAEMRHGDGQLCETVGWVPHRQHDDQHRWDVPGPGLVSVCVQHSGQGTTSTQTWRELNGEACLWRLVLWNESWRCYFEAWHCVELPMLPVHCF